MSEEVLSSRVRQLVDRFQERASATTKIIGTWAPALVLLWFVGLERKAEDIRQFQEEKVTVSEISAKAVTRAVLLADAPISKELLENKNQELASTKALAEVAFKVPGFEIPVPSIWAPPLWSIFYFFLTLYVTGQRAALLNLAGRVVRRVEAESINSEAVIEILHRAPIWLAPLPSNQGAVASQAKLKYAFGWFLHSSLFAWLTIICAGLLLLIEARVIWLAFDFSGTVGRGYQAWLPPWIALMTGGGAIGAQLWSFAMSTIPDHEPTANTPYAAISRRSMLLYTASVCALSVLLIANRLPYRLPLKVMRRNPRFRRRKVGRLTTVSVESPGLYLNMKSKVGHYVFSEGEILGAGGIKAGNLTAAMFTDMQTPPARPRVHIARASATFESIALGFIAEKRYKDACDALLAGIKYNQYRLTTRNDLPDYRLCDLLAGIAVRYNQPEALSQLLAVVRVRASSTLPTYSERSLVGRVKKWQDESSAWCRRWHDHSKSVNWCALPMQDTLSGSS